MTRAERYAQITEARAAGEHYKETCRRLGISVAYYFEVLKDPSGRMLRAKYERHRHPCPKCGTPMAWRGGPKRTSPRTHPALCKSCDLERRAEHRIWTEESIVEALRYAAAMLGRTPLTSETNPGLASPRNRKRDKETMEQLGLPRYTTILHVFGSWRAAVEAAGLEYRKVGAKVRVGSGRAGA